MTRFPALFTAGMHRSEHRNRDRRAPSLWTSQRPIWPAAGSMPFSAPQRISQSESVARNSLSLACNGSGLSPAPFQGQRSRPAASLPNLLRLRPVRPCAPQPAAVCTRCRPFHCALPVAVSETGPVRRSPGLHSPSGLLSPSGSKRSAVPLRANPPSESARSPFAPRRRSNYH